jgi:inner membrane protein involved in colicin E2 resistance
MNYYRLTVRQLRWREYWPVGWIIILATTQLVLTFTIIGLEVVSMIADFYHSMIFAGYYCSLFFTITWLSMFTVSKYTKVKGFIQYDLICLSLL